MSLQVRRPLGYVIMTTPECWSMDLSSMAFVSLNQFACSLKSCKRLQDCKGMVGLRLVVKSISVCVLVFFCLSCVPVGTGTYGVQVKELR